MYLIALSFSEHIEDLALHEILDQLLFGKASHFLIYNGKLSYSVSSVL